MGILRSGCIQNPDLENPKELVHSPGHYRLGNQEAAQCTDACRQPDQQQVCTDPAEQAKVCSDLILSDLGKNSARQPTVKDENRRY